MVCADLEPNILRAQEIAHRESGAEKEAQTNGRAQVCTRPNLTEDKVCRGKLRLGQPDELHRPAAADGQRDKA